MKNEIKIIKLLIQGLTYMNEGNVKAAIAVFDQVLALDPNNIKTLEYQALAYEIENKPRFTKAIDNYNKILNIEPDNLDALLGRGNDLLELKKGWFQKTEQAIEDFNAVLAIDPLNTDALLGRAEANAKFLGLNCNDVIADCNKALAIDDTLAEAYGMRGACHFSNLDKPNYQQALIDLDQAIKLDPDDYYYYYCKGLMHYKKGPMQNDEQALKYFSLTLEHEPECFDALIWRAELLLLLPQPDYKQASKDIRAATKIDPYNEEIYLAKGLLFHKQKAPQIEKAIKLFDEYLKIRLLETEKVHLFRANALMDLPFPNYQKALQDYAEVLKKEPDNIFALLGQARAYCGKSDREQYDKVRENCNKILAINPHNAQALWAIGFTYHDGFDQNWTKALQFYKQALAADSYNLDALYWQAAIFNKNNVDYRNFEQVVLNCNKAIDEIGFDLKDKPFYLGFYHMRAKANEFKKYPNYQQAIDDLNKIVETKELTKEYYLASFAAKTIPEVKAKLARVKLN